MHVLLNHFEKRITRYILVVPFCVIALDIFTKFLVVKFLMHGDVWPSESWPVQIIYVTNTGAAFGLFQEAGLFLILASIVGIALVSFYFLRPVLKNSLRFALGLILGGACGNLIDRAIKGEVPDFIKFPEWPTFNVADSAITIGVVLLLWVIYHESKSQVTPTKAP
tara:strand:+ start:145 stop:642 length:498 start_codon:yes stop_codon:yes gene_type:complete